MRKRGREAWAKWKGLIAEQGRSDRSVAAFCRERGVPASQFFAWKRRLRQDANEQFVEVRIAGGATPPATTPHLAIEIRVEGGQRVFVAPGFDGDHLRAVLAVLETRA
jgi:hypothetical protein